MSERKIQSSNIYHNWINYKLCKIFLISLVFLVNVYIIGNFHPISAPLSEIRVFLRGIHTSFSP